MTGSCYYNQNSFFDYFEENKLISCITGFTFTVIFIFIYILKAYTFFDKRRIPRAVDPTAPFGNIKDVLFQETTFYVYLWKYYNKFKRKGFKYGGLYLFFKPSILVVDSIVMQKILTEKKCITDGHRNYFPEVSTVVDLFTEDNLENFLLRYSSIKDTLLVDLDEKCTSTVLHNFFMETTSSAFGFKISLETLPAINALLNKKTSSGFKYYFGLVYPLFERNKLVPEMQNLLKDIFEYRKKNDIRETDLIQSFIDLYNDGDYNLNDMILGIFDIIVDNIIYSYSSMMFCLYELASNKDIQKNLIQEIERFNNQNKSVGLKALRQLSYLDAVVKETLRKYPPVPTIIKKCKECYKIDGTDSELPKGTFILHSVMGVHYDPLNYSDPGKFRPDRFLEAPNKVDMSNVYIPFGLDKQKEIGFRFTVLHVKLGIISILSSYSVGMNSKSAMEFDNKKVPVYPKEPLPIVFESILK